MLIFILSAAAVVVFLDFIFKMLAAAYLKPIGSCNIMGSFLSFTYSTNKGAAFGMFSGARVLFVIVAVVTIAAFIIFIKKNKKLPRIIAAADILIIGGGIGNLIDRIRLGYVIDYIQLVFFPPVFNFADCCITVGSALLLVYFLAYKDHKKEG